MIRSITIKARDIYGAADTIYDGKDNLEDLIFQNVLGLSFSGDGITYVIEKDISSITISSNRFNFSDTYTYDSSSFLSWPADSTGYSLYTGNFTSIDDGFATTPVTLPTAFSSNNLSSDQLYLSTNGYFTLGSGSGNIISSPQGQSNPAGLAGNTTDLWLQKGLVNSDGDTQNFWYILGQDGANRFFIKILVYAGAYGLPTTPRSYLLNFYRDTDYQWLEARAKSNATGRVGPYNSIDVSQGSSTTSQVWRGDLNGTNWTYLGTGSVKP